MLPQRVSAEYKLLGKITASWFKWAEMDVSEEEQNYTRKETKPIPIIVFLMS